MPKLQETAPRWSEHPQETKFVILTYRYFKTIPKPATKDRSKARDHEDLDRCRLDLNVLLSRTKWNTPKDRNPVWILVEAPTQADRRYVIFHPNVTTGKTRRTLINKVESMEAIRRGNAPIRVLSAAKFNLFRLKITPSRNLASIRIGTWDRALRIGHS